MNALMPLIEQVIVNRLVSSKAPLMGKNKWGMVFIALSCILFLTTATFIIVAGYNWLLAYYSTPTAALICAALIFTIAVLSALAGYIALKKQPTQKPVREDDVNHLLSLLGEAIEEEWATPIRENPKTALLIASIGGFVAGDHLH